ncbi:MAG: hypothetical protein WA885_17295 [Phormidesmis sp.]
MVLAYILCRKNKEKTMGWFSSIVKIANTATGFYLNNFADDGQGISADSQSRATTTIGDLSFINDVKDQKTWIENKSDQDYYAYFSSAQDDGNLSGEHFLIKAKDKSDFTACMKKYKDGQITYSPSTESKTNDASVISFAAEYIVKDSTKFGGDGEYELTMSKDKKTNKQLIFSARREFDSFEMSFVDRNGINFNVRDEAIDIASDIYMARVDIPSGCSEIYPYRDVKILVTVSGEDLKDLKQELLSKMTKTVE